MYEKIFLNENKLTHFEAEVFRPILEQMAPHGKPNAYLSIGYKSRCQFQHFIQFYKKRWFILHLFDLTDNLQCNEDQVCDFAWISYHNEMLIFALDSLAGCKRGNMDIPIDYGSRLKSEIGKKIISLHSIFIHLHYSLLF